MASTEEIHVNKPANDVLFTDLCTVLENLFKRKNKRVEQQKILENFINEYRTNVGKLTGKKNNSFYPILRLLIPDKERERPAYNMKESKLGILLVKVLSINAESEDGKKLRNFRSVQTSQESDFAGVVYYVLKKRVSGNSGTLTVGDINVILDKIATAEVGNKGPVLDEAFTYALKNLSAQETKWFLRIILKDLKLGMGAHKILGAFHADAPDLFDSCGNLSKVCEELGEGDTRPPELGLRLFFAVSPMLSERLDVTRSAAVLFAAGPVPYQVENKFDGERFQMHMENDVFEYYSRKGFTYADTYGKTFDSGLLTPLLKDCFSPSVNSFILDGEMMGWHKQYQCFGTKGMAFDVKKITENSRFRACYCVFDVLYLNGKSLVGPPDKGGLPLSKRIEILKTLFSDKPGVLMHSKYSEINNFMEVLDALNKAIEDQEEGIVVKDRQSYYIANKRNAGWYKIKPEYTKNTMEDLDLVIIGAEEAENKRQGRARSFHVACADIANPGDSPHRWLDVGKVATGFTYEERERVCALLEKNWVLRKRALPPPNLVFNKEKPDYWIKPEHSLVLQVRATELIRSTDFGTDYTLRFPRVVAIRDDKPINDAMTLNEFNKLVADKGAVVKLSNKRVNADQIDSVEIKSRRKREAKPLQVPEQFRTKAGDVEVTSQALAGRKVYIVTDDEDCKKPELVRIVESHGAKHVENIGPDTWCCVVGHSNFRSRKLIEAQELDILPTTWLRSLPPSDTPCTLSPLDMLSIKKATKLALSRNYDRFGDSYTEEIDEGTLKRCFKRMEAQEPEIYLTNAEMLCIDEDLFGDCNPFSYLRPCHIHFTKTRTLLEIKARMYGGNTCDMDSPNLTHVVVFDGQNVEMFVSKSKKNVAVVSENWLKTCFKEEQLVPHTKFVLI